MVGPRLHKARLMIDLQVVIPYLWMKWCLEDVIESCGDTDIPILIIDNSPESDTDSPRFQNLPSNVTIEKFPENIGVSAAWNRGLRLGHDYTLICSQMVRFASMDIQRRKEPYGLNIVARYIEDYGDEYGLNFGDQGFHLICIGKATVDKVGLFDENIFSYGNDDDYWRRMQLAGIEFKGLPGEQLKEIYSIGWAAHNREGTIPPPTEDYYSRK